LYAQTTQIGETPLKKTPILIALFAFVVGIAVAQYVFTASPTAPSAAMGTRVPVVAGKFGGDFTLTQQGKSVKLSDFQDKVVVLYFGYTSCPDICPTSLATLSAGLKTLSAAELAQVQPIFISVDPERDAGDNLMKYAQHFHPNLIGITGTADEVQQAARQYGAFYAKVQSNSAMGYLIDHTSNTYLISKAGQFVTILPHDMTPDTVAAGIRQELH
jgi:protein SCO1/2